MNTDREMTFSPDQAITTGVQLGQDVYNGGVGGVNINTGRELEIFASVTEDMTGGTSLKAELIESDSPALTSPRVLATSEVVPVADLVAGKVLLRSTFPRSSKQWFGMRYTSVGTFTAGTVWAGVVCTSDDTVIPAYETGR